jgi:hypothetical protein
MKLRAVVFIGILMSLYSAVISAEDEIDVWSGIYRLKAINPESEGGSMKILIVKSPDADPDKVADKSKSNLARWEFATGRAKQGSEPIIARRFFADEYQQFNWFDLHKSNQMDCLDAGRIFICKTTPNTKVNLDKEGKKTIFAESGMFGVALLEGSFELFKVIKNE